MKKEYWFKRRRYGWGYTPSTWQGWVTLGVWLIYIGIQIVLLVAETPVNQAGDSVLFFAAIVLATAALLFITFEKGPKPKWRWGKKPGDSKHEDF